MSATEAPRPRWIKTAEVAKLIRKHLKEAFPGQKFYVRSSSYSGGSSISVGWTDGPTTREVKAVTGPFQGARFDGSIDLQYAASQWYCPEHGASVAEIYGHSYDAESVGTGFGNGPVSSRCCAKAELVNMGVSYIHERRDLSPEFEKELQDKVAKQEGRPYDPMYHDGHEWMSTLVYRESVETSKYVAPAAK